MYKENDELDISTTKKKQNQSFLNKINSIQIHTLDVYRFVRLIKSYSTTATLSKYLTTRLSINFKVYKFY